MKRKSLIVAALTVAALAGCKDSGGGDNGGNNGDNGGNGSNKAASAEQVTKAIQGTWKLENGLELTVNTDLTFPLSDPANIARNDTYKCGMYRCALDPNAPAVENKTARFVADENNLIPVYYNVNPRSGKPESKDPRFAEAIKMINDVVGRPVFKDMGYIHVDHHLTQSEIDLDYSSVAGKGGLIFSVGTSVKAFGNQASCGSSSEGPNNQGVPRKIIDEKNYFKEDGGWTWINLDSSDGKCLGTTEIAAHELMHALGFDAHFDGFGADGEVFGDRAKAALRTLYNNDAQLDPENLTYYHWPAK